MLLFKINMKAKHLVLFLSMIFSILLLGLTSCKKCVDCTDPVSYRTESQCGVKSVTKSYKSTMEELNYTCNYR